MYSTIITKTMFTPTEPVKVNREPYISRLIHGRPTDHFLINWEFDEETSVINCKVIKKVSVSYINVNITIERSEKQVIFNTEV